MRIFHLTASSAALCVGTLAFTLTATPAWADTSIAIAGSTALLPLVKASAQLYGSSHPDTEISVTGGGSGVGLTQVAASAVDIGDSDVQAPKGSTLVDHKVAVIGFAIVTNPAINLPSLTQQQIAGIFSNRIKNWSAVGGPHLDIIIVNRPNSSGTRNVFKHSIMGHATISDSGLTVDASGTVVATVEATPGAISYVALSALRDAQVKTVAINHIQPSAATIELGRYPFWSYEHMYTKGTASAPVARFISYVAGNTSLLTKLGYIPMKAMHSARNDR